MHDNEQQSKGGMTKMLISGAVLVAVGAGVYAVARQPLATPNTNDQVAVPTTTTPTTTPTSPQVDTPVYANGEYSQDGVYVSPGGAETLGVTLTLKDDVVVDAAVVVKATLPASMNWQQTFASGFKSQVVGKKLNEVNLGKISGSSLTPIGFNDAVAKIKSQAKG